MPTYEYECRKCGLRFEAFQKISDPPKENCPQCKAKLRRLITAGAGIIFKGSGFYATDYRKKEAKEKKERKTSCSECPVSSECDKKKE